VPTSIDGAGGVTVIEFSEALVTVSVAVPETLPELAVMVEVPPLTPVASPLVPPALLMVATLVAEEVHVTELVRFCVLWSLSVPVAMNWDVVVGAMDAAVVVTAIETNVGGGGVPPPPPEPPPQPTRIITDRRSSRPRARFTRYLHLRLLAFNPPRWEDPN
jgi:hypothetical protein